MANYRPKSLNELGNLYDKSLEAENEIKKSSSKLEDKPVSTATAFLPEDEEALPMKKTPQQIAADEIASRIGDFAKSFGNDNVDTTKKPLAIATVQSKPRPKKKLDADVQKDAQEKKKASEPAKPRLIRNSERTDLFENYKKVMDDEDDYNFGEPEKVKRGRLRKNKNIEPEVTEQKAEAEKKDAIELQAETAVGAVFEDVVTEKKDKKEQEEKAQFKKVSYEDYIATRVEPEKEAQEEKIEGEKNPLKQIVLMVLLLCVLVTSIGIGSIKAFSGANSDKAVFGNHYVYTAKRNFTDVSLRKGTLVITENKQPEAGDVVAYKIDSGVYAFAKFESVLNVESVIANDGAQQILIFNSDLRGVVSKTFPAVGFIVAAIMSYFLPIMGLMLLLAALLILLIYFVSKDRNTYYEEAEEEYDEAEYEEEEEYSETETNQEPEEEYSPEELSDYDDDPQDDLESLFSL